MILGLDISTSITGVTVLSDEGEILHCEAIDTRNKNHFPTLFEKASKVRDYLGDIEYKYDIEHIYIEKSHALLQYEINGSQAVITNSHVVASFQLHHCLKSKLWICVTVFGSLSKMRTSVSYL